MTLAEKLGQLTMTAAGYAVTGPVIAGDSTESIRNGTLGNLLNIVGAKHVHEMQRIAVEESRLGIPLLIGLDVIHGHRTIFPVPLAEAATFDPRIWELTAREAARETAADGLAMTFAPMLDVSRDLRWGRTVEGPGEDPWLAVQIARAKVRGFQGADLAHAESRGRDGQALLRLRPGDRRARLRVGRHLRAHAARSASAGIRSGRSCGRGGDHAGVHRSRAASR